MFEMAQKDESISDPAKFIQGQASQELQSWNNILRTYGKVWATMPETALEDLYKKLAEDAA